MEGSNKGEDVYTNFSTNRFYGSNQGPSASSNRMQDKLVQVAKGAEHLSQHPLPSEYYPGILGPPATWKIFTRQAEAIKFAQVMGAGLMVFSFEGDAIGTGGKRNFVVTHPSQMWLRQKERVPERRCAYEVIQEKCVCKLYFDLEFLHAHNHGKDGVAMTNTFITIVCYFLHDEFNVSCSRKSILDLMGTSGLKFSRHLIFNITGVAFVNNAHAGFFVRMVCNKIRMWCEGRDPIAVPGISLQDVKDLFVLNSRNDEVLFCDEGVYSKNRNFRMFLSTKFGQNFPLIIAEENEYTPCNGSGACKDEQVFFDSLITLVNSNCKILTCKENEQPLMERTHMSNANSKGNVDLDVEGIRQSPFPEIDDFIESIIGSGKIQSWHYFSQSEVIVYNIVFYRFCHNIDREHKSNNIYYVVSLKTATYYQKCHDPDCRDFRSPSWPLPKSAVFWQDMNEEEMMDWIHAVQDDDSSTIKAVTVTDTIQSEDELDDQLVRAVDAMEKWDHLEEIVNFQSSSQRSLKSSQESSLSSNPWDKLSQLSSPNTSFMESISQGSQVQPQNMDAGDHQGLEQERCLPCDDSDEDFMRAVLIAEEQLQCVDSEVEIAC